MRKGDLAAALQERVGYSLHRCETIINALFGADDGILTRELSSPHGKATITGFGTLEAVSRAQRNVTHPKSGQTMVVPAQTGVRFRPSTQLKAALRKIPTR